MASHYAHFWKIMPLPAKTSLHQFSLEKVRNECELQLLVEKVKFKFETSTVCPTRDCPDAKGRDQGKNYCIHSPTEKCLKCLNAHTQIHML